MFKKMFLSSFKNLLEIQKSGSYEPLRLSTKPEKSEWISWLLIFLGSEETAVESLSMV